ncbi:hypothetical protein FE257_005411 [Aspergillus nanangensis]|uniref:Acetyl-CoA synthetase-like protein n=1 Tax=Aspergillus nanangensis TaxID=2582783 RepID=A0AAD4CQH3_ASPNN|nr:hypothetical protein FE257_005411 [Aspergillus nanangensis]
MANIITSGMSPLLDASSLSIPELMSHYNPDGVESEKIVHTDDFSNNPITYGGLRSHSASAAWGLRHQLGLQEGDVLLALVPNSNDFVYLAHATWWAGGVFTPLNFSSTTKDIQHVLQLVRPAYIVTTDAKLASVEAALSQCSIQKPKIVTVLSRVEGLLWFPNDFTSDNSSQTLPPYTLRGKHARNVTSTICFSSGTTGKMKGVQLSHYNIIMNILQIRAALPGHINGGVREAWFPPYCHIYGLGTVVLTGMWVGAQFHGMVAFDMDKFYRKAVELNVTNMHLVPPVALALASMESHGSEIPALRQIVVAAAPLKKPLQMQLNEKFPNAAICQGYGLSECSPTVMHQHDNRDASVGSVGKVVPGTEVRLVDPVTGKDVSVGEEGELWVRGPQVMMGYFNDEAATKGTFVGEWLRTGDIMKMDEHQNFWVTDRMKEMIKYKGFQVAPSELEDLLLQHPQVIDAAVCATYDDAQATEVPLAYVSLLPEKACLPAWDKEKILKGVRDWVDGQVAGYKKLRGGVFHLQTLPKSPTGKILRRELPKMRANKRGSGL